MLRCCPQLICLVGALVAARLGAVAGGATAAVETGLFTAPPQPVARQWTTVRLRPDSGADAVTAVTLSWAVGEGETGNASLQPAGTGWEARVVFPREGLYSLTFTTRGPAAATASVLTYPLRVAAPKLPPAETPVLLWVDADTREVVLVEPRSAEVLGSLALPGIPLCASADESAGLLWLVCSATDDGDAFALPLDWETWAFGESLPLPIRPADLLAVGHRLYLTEESGNRVCRLSRDRPETATWIPVGPGPRVMSLLPDRKLLCLTNSDLRNEDPYDSVSVVDLSKGEETVRLPVGRNPIDLSVTAEGSRLHVACGGGARVVTVDTATWRQVAVVPLEGQPIGLTALSPDRLAIACRMPPALLLYDPEADALEAQLDLPAAPVQILAASGPDGQLFAACDDGSLLAVAATLQGAMRRVPVGRHPVALYWRQARALEE